jgi:hypothetical protein
MSNEMIVSVPSVPTQWDESFIENMSKGGFNRMQLYGSSSREVKTGAIGMGHFGYVEGKEICDVGKEFDCIILAWRPKAIKFSDEKVVVSHEPESELFKQIMQDSDSKVQEVRMGNMAGPEFLLWFPSKETFVPYLLGNKSSRYETRAFVSRIGRSATVKSVLVEANGYSWHAPKCIDCKNVINPLPDDEAIAAAIQDFNNPKIQTAEQAPEAEPVSDRTV